MEDDLQRELNFLIAKTLRDEFPDIFNAFIDRCQTEDRFPSSVFYQHPTFAQLTENALPGIPDDKLFRIVKAACSRSHAPSLLSNEATRPSALSASDSLIHDLCPVRSFFEKFGSDVRIQGHYDSIFCLAMDATSQILITGSDDYRVKLWYIDGDVSLMESCHWHSDVISDVQVHPSNAFFATSSHDGTICIVDIKTCLLMKRLTFQGKIHTMRFSPDGSLLAAALEEGSVRIMSVPDFDEFFALSLPSGKSADWVEFSAGGSFLAITAEPHDLIILSLHTLQYHALDGHTELPDFVAFRKGSCESLISCSYQEKYLKMWTTEGKCWDSNVELSLKAQSKAKVVRASFNCNDSLIVAISTGSIFCWSTATHELVTMCQHPMFTEHCSILAVHPYMADIAFVGCQSGRAAIWDVKRGDVVVALQMEDGRSISEAIWSPDGQTIIAGDAEGGFTLFRRSEGRCLTQELFLRKDIDEGASGGEWIYMDSQGEPLDPQPRRHVLGDLRTGVQMKSINAQTLKEEETVLRMRWPASSVEDAKSFVSRSPECEEDSDGISEPAFSNLTGHAIRTSTRQVRRMFGASDSFSTLHDISTSGSEEYSYSSDEEGLPIAWTRPRRDSVTVTQAPSRPRVGIASRRQRYVERTEFVTVTGRRSQAPRSFSPPDARPPKPKTRKRVIEPSSDDEHVVSRSRNRFGSSDDENAAPVAKRNVRQRKLTPPRSLEVLEKSRRGRISYDDDDDSPVATRSGRISKKVNLDVDFHTAPKKAVTATRSTNQKTERSTSPPSARRSTPVRRQRDPSPPPLPPSMRTSTTRRQRIISPPSSLSSSSSSSPPPSPRRSVPTRRQLDSSPPTRSSMSTRRGPTLSPPARKSMITRRGTEPSPVSPSGKLTTTNTDPPPRKPARIPKKPEPSQTSASRRSPDVKNSRTTRRHNTWEITSSDEEPPKRVVRETRRTKAVVAPPETDFVITQTGRVVRKRKFT